jgi:hypothetical protein
MENAPRGWLHFHRGLLTWFKALALEFHEFRDTKGLAIVQTGV